MPTHESLRRQIAAILAGCLGSAKGPVNPAEFGAACFRNLPDARRRELLAQSDRLIEELFVHVAREQTKSRPPEQGQVEAFPVDTWISSAKQGQRVQYRNATWDDHMAHRQHQMENVKSVTRAFRDEEERRNKLRSVGMADDPTMTTDQAIARLSGHADTAAA